MLNFQRDHDFLVGVDSDGCVFDSMEMKHKECFIPNFVNSYNLQGVSKYARQAWEFVNLYSKSRGVNRFPALVKSLQALSQHPETASRGVEVRVPESLVRWISEEHKLGNPTLAAKVAETNDPDLQQALEWSQAVNDQVERFVRNVPPFPWVRECLAKLQESADLLVVSGTPNDALCREWDEHDLTRYVHTICGQELGSKAETLSVAKQYEPNRALMIGDAPGDYQAAQTNGVLFFPINPGDEETSWRRLYEEGIDRFVNGTFAGDYQQQLLQAFDACLPSEPPWSQG